MRLYPTPIRKPQTVAFSPDGRRLVLAGPFDGVWVLDGSSGNGLGPPLLGSAYYGWDASFTEDGRSVLLANAGAGWQSICCETWKASSLYHFGAEGPRAMCAADSWVVVATVVHPVTAVGPWKCVRLHAFRFSPDGSHNHLWSLPTPAALISSVGAAASPSEHFYSVEHRAFQAEGPFNKITLVQRERHTGAMTAEVAVGSERADRLVVSADGRWVAVTTGPTVRLWDVTNLGKKPRKLVVPSRKHILGAASFADGQRLMTVGNDGRAVAWDIGTGAVIAQYDWQIGKLSAVAFAPDGLTCAAGSDTGQVVLFDVDG
jgi:WD40 repeat protein